MSGKARAFYPITLLGLALLLGGCVSGGFQGERDSAMGWWAMTTPGVLGGILGERDAAMATSRYEELEKIGERETGGPGIFPVAQTHAAVHGLRQACATTSFSRASTGSSGQYP